jgi:hypothetical protein
MVTIATFNEPVKAKHLKTRLQGAGLKADVHNEGHLQQMAFMSKPQASAKVQVHEDRKKFTARIATLPGGKTATRSRSRRPGKRFRKRSAIVGRFCETPSSRRLT